MAALHSKTFLLIMGLVFALLLILSSDQVSARELAQASQTQGSGVEEDKHWGHGQEHHRHHHHHHHDNDHDNDHDHHYHHHHHHHHHPAHPSKPGHGGAGEN